MSWNAGTQNKDLYVYDALGKRVLRRTTTISGTTMTVYAFGLEEHSYFNSGGHKSDLYYYTLGGRLLGALDNTGKTTFYLSDALGSVLASFSSAAGIAAIKGNQVFGPYGNPRDFQGTINTAKGFTGQYNDSLTGLDYYGSRYYDQVAGVFLSADTVHGNSSGANPYAYVGGNPETLADPSGQMPCAGPGGPCGWPTRPSGGVTGGGGGTSSPSSMVQPVNAFVPTSTAAQGGSLPCRDIGCVNLLRVKVGFQATVNHLMSVNLPTMVCAEYCFVTIGDGQTIGTTKMSGVEAPFTHCGVSPFACSNEHAQDGGDMGVNGHDMPDVAAADTGGGAARNPGDETNGPNEPPLQVEPGQWMAVNKHMSARAAQYQTQITGRQPGWAYVVDGVKFDGYLDGTLLEAKGPGYDSFLTPNGEFKSWFTGDQSMINEAVRQVGVAGQIPIEWHVAELRSYNAIRQLLAGFDSIQVIHTPFLP